LLEKDFGGIDRESKIQTFCFICDKIDVKEYKEFLKIMKNHLGSDKVKS